jgi:hypothetical protein
MTSVKVSQFEHAPFQKTEFRIVCMNCDAVGVVFDCAENAPPSTPIKCRHCGAPRGTLGDLRNLSYATRRDRFDV